MLDGVKDGYLGVDRIKGVLSVDESCGAALALHLRNSVHRQRRLAATLRAKHLHIEQGMQSDYTKTIPPDNNGCC